MLTKLTSPGQDTRAQEDHPLATDAEKNTAEAKAKTQNTKSSMQKTTQSVQEGNTVTEEEETRALRAQRHQTRTRPSPDPHQTPTRPHISW